MVAMVFRVIVTVSLFLINQILLFIVIVVLVTL